MSQAHDTTPISYVETFDRWPHKMVCPRCGYDYTHVLGHLAFNTNSDDAGKAWAGRGDLFRVPVWGECGHVWAVAFGFHKGETFLYSELLSTEDLSYDEATALIERLQRTP